MLTVDEAAKILQNPKDHWSHEVAEAHDVADRVLIAMANINGMYFSVVRELLNTHLKNIEEGRSVLCSMNTTATTKSTCE